MDPNTNTPILEQVPRKISNFDKNALNTAIKLKEEHGGEVITVTACLVNPFKGVKEALAMGRRYGLNCE